MTEVVTTRLAYTAPEEVEDMDALNNILGRMLANDIGKRAVDNYKTGLSKSYTEFAITDYNICKVVFNIFLERYSYIADIGMLCETKHGEETTTFVFRWLEQ
jgi:hypothetical protein